jgi:DinB superfamily
MDVRQALKQTMDTGEFVSMAYLGDLTDAELIRRPHPECNHILWQLGHLIASEHQMVESVLPGSMPPLPAGFAERYTPETAKSDDPAKFDSRATLMKVYREQRDAAVAKLQALSNEELSRESPEAVRSYAPDVAAIFGLQGGHWLMHAGQWAVLRRQLGRPPLF